jgi:hypothetical protein
MHMLQTQDRPLHRSVRLIKSSDVNWPQSKPFDVKVELVVHAEVEPLQKAAFAVEKKALILAGREWPKI